MKRLLGDAPTDVSNNIYHMVHELSLSDVKKELTDRDWHYHRLKTTVQSYATEGLLLVEQLENGMIGQNVTIMSRNGEEVESIGFTRRSYNRLLMDVMKHWHQNVSSNKEIKDWTDDDYTTNYGTWKKDIGNGLSRIRLMVNSFPDGLHWNGEFDEFNFNAVNQTNLFWSDFPGFLPIEIIIPSRYVTGSIVELDQHQIPVKYGFEEDVVFTSKKVDRIALSECHIERQQIMIDIMEFFITKPTILVHSPKFRETILKKMDELLESIDYLTKPFDENTLVVLNVVERMNTVIGAIVTDPLYTV